MQHATQVGRGRVYPFFVSDLCVGERIRQPIGNLFETGGTRQQLIGTVAVLRPADPHGHVAVGGREPELDHLVVVGFAWQAGCLLYTSDAADE